MPEMVWRSAMPTAAAAVFAWHARPGALERLLPPWQAVEVLERDGDGIHDGARVVLGVGPGPLQMRWVARHEGFADGREFRDVQEHGPFAAWTHTHRFLDEGPERSVLEDRVVYALPLAAVTERVAGQRTRAALARMFAFRHARVREDLRRHAAAPGPALRVAVSGASGLVGRALCAFLTTGGHDVRRLVRSGSTPAPGDVAWDPAAGTIDAAALDGVDAVVHLAGEPIAARWTPERRRAIHDSRVLGTALLSRTLARLTHRPRVLISASAIGWYGDRGDEPLDERAGPGAGFLAEVCREWEAATVPAEAAGIRVVHARVGVVLSGRGGALPRMLPPFKLGLGGVVGSGRQVLSWIALDDVVYAIHHLLAAERIVGPVNLTAPAPLSNAAFTRALGHVLRRPTAFRVPAAVLRAAFGEMADEVLLAGACVVPRVLTDAGFRFLHADVEGALRAEMGL